MIKSEKIKRTLVLLIKVMLVQFLLAVGLGLISLKIDGYRSGAIFSLLNAISYSADAFFFVGLFSATFGGYRINRDFSYLKRIIKENKSAVAVNDDYVEKLKERNDVSLSEVKNIVKVSDKTFFIVLILTGILDFLIAFGVVLLII